MEGRPWRGGTPARHPLEHRQHSCELLPELVRITRVCSPRNASTSSSSLLLTETERGASSVSSDDPHRPCKARTGPSTLSTAALLIARPCCRERSEPSRRCACSQVLKGTVGQPPDRRSASADSHRRQPSWCSFRLKTGLLLRRTPEPDRRQPVARGWDQRVCRAKIDDDEGLIRVHRQIPAGRREVILARGIAKLLQALARLGVQATGRLRLRQHARPGLDYRDAGEAFRGAVKHAGPAPPAGLSLHSLRHAFASFLIANGLNVVLSRGNSATPTPASPSAPTPTHSSAQTTQ